MILPFCHDCVCFPQVPTWLIPPPSIYPHATFPMRTWGPVWMETHPHVCFWSTSLDNFFPLWPLTPNMLYNLVIYYVYCPLSPPVMVNFIHQLNWNTGCPDIWSNTILWGYFWMRLTCTLVDRVQSIALLKWVGPIGWVQVPEYNKRLTLPRGFIMPAGLPTGTPAFSGLQTQTESPVLPGSQACWPLAWNSTISSPGSAACQLTVSLPIQENPE